VAGQAAGKSFPVVVKTARPGHFGLKMCTSPERTLDLKTRKEGRGSEIGKCWGGRRTVPVIMKGHKSKKLTFGKSGGSRGVRKLRQRRQRGKVRARSRRRRRAISIDQTIKNSASFQERGAKVKRVKRGGGGGRRRKKNKVSGGPSLSILQRGSVLKKWGERRMKMRGERRLFGSSREDLL